MSVYPPNSNAIQYCSSCLPCDTWAIGSSTWAGGVAPISPCFPTYAESKGFSTPVQGQYQPNLAWVAPASFSGSGGGYNGGEWEQYNLLAVTEPNSTLLSTFKEIAQGVYNMQFAGSSPYSGASCCGDLISTCAMQGSGSGTHGCGKPLLTPGTYGPNAAFAPLTPPTTVAPKKLKPAGPPPPNPYAPLSPESGDNNSGFSDTDWTFVVGGLAVAGVLFFVLVK